jgi:putative nucleotidyltransferase with HDIG domain
MRSNAKKLSILNEVARALTSTIDRDALLDRIIDGVYDVFSLSTCAVLLFDQKTQKLSIARARGYEPSVVMQYRGTPGKGIAGWVFKHGKEVLIKDVKSDPRYVPGVREAVAEMAAPLKIDSEILGVLDAETTNSDVFEAADLDLFSAFAAQAAVCLHNARLHRRLKNKHDELQTLLGRQNAVAAAAALLQKDLDLGVVLERILALSHKALGFEACAVLLLQADGRLKIEACHGYPPAVEKTYIEPGTGISAEVIETKRPVLVADVSRDPRYIEGVVGGGCEMIVPLAVGKQLLGVLDAEACRVDAYGSADLELFSVFGAHAAMAIQNARQVAHIKQREIELSQKKKALEAGLVNMRVLHQISEKICSVLNLDLVLAQTLELAQQALPFERCAVLLLDTERDCLVVRAAHGYRRDVASMEIPLGRGVTGRVAHSGKAEIISNVEQNGDYIPGVEGGQSEMAVPLRADGRIIGVLDAEACETNAFGPRDLELFDTFASWVAIAVHNADLYERLQETNKQLSKNLVEIERMNKELSSYSQRIEKANTELEQRVRELVTLYEATKTITSSLDLEATLKTIENLSREIIHASSSAIRLLDIETGEILTTTEEKADKLSQDRPFTMEAPLKIGDRTIGIFELAGTQRFRAEDERMIQTLASQAAIAIENAQLFERTQRTYFETIRSLAQALEARDPYTRGHSERVTQYALAIGEAMNMDATHLKLLEHAGLLHDIGKIGISDLILHKTSKLSPADRALIEKHPLLGGSILGPIRFLENVQHIVRHHHERYDGSGYPQGLAGKAIPLAARIVAVADSFDAMTSDRPYRPAMSRNEAMEELRKNSGTQFDPAVVAVFLDILKTRWLDVGAVKS